MTQANMGLHPVAPATAKPPTMDERTKLFHSSHEGDSETETKRSQLLHTKHVGLVVPFG